jgi:hypothetical protein
MTAARSKASVEPAFSRKQLPVAKKPALHRNASRGKGPFAGPSALDAADSLQPGAGVDFRL